MPEKSLLTDVVLSAYYEIVPDPSARAVSLMKKLAAALYERGARISIGEITPPPERYVHHSLDSDQRLVWTSKDWNLVMGYRAQEAIGLHASAFLAGETYAFFRDFGWRALLENGKMGPVVSTFVTKHGERLPGSWRSEVMNGEGGCFERTFAKVRIREPLLHKMAAGY